MLPRLQAEEQLAGVRIGALAGGFYPPNDRRAVLDGLERRAAGEGHQRPKKAMPADLAAMGVGVVSVPPEKGVNDG